MFFHVKMHEQFWFGFFDLILIIWAASFGKTHDYDNLLAIQTMFKTVLPPPSEPIFIELLNAQVPAAAVANVHQSAIDFAFKRVKNDTCHFLYHDSMQYVHNIAFLEMEFFTVSVQFSWKFNIWLETCWNSVVIGFVRFVQPVWK